MQEFLFADRDKGGLFDPVDCVQVVQDAQVSRHNKTMIEGGHAVFIGDLLKP